MTDARDKPKVVGVFEAYLDESGTEETHCAVAGFVGLATKWRVFESAWCEALSEAGVDHFHSKQFFAGSRPFDVVSKAKRRRLIETLVSLVTDKGTGLHPVASAVDVRAFFARTEHERIYLTGGRWSGDKWTFPGAPTRPYSLPLCNVMDRCHRSVVRVDVVHDQHDVYSKHVLRLHGEMKKHRRPIALRAGIGDLVFASKRERIPLQAADLIAYLTFSRVAYGKQTGDDDIGIASRAFGAFGQRVIVFYDDTSIESHLAASIPRTIRDGRTPSQIRATRQNERGRQQQRERQQMPRKRAKDPR